MKSISICAKKDNLGFVLNFIESEVEKIECAEKDKLVILVAIEEIFINISNYAYECGDGFATVCCEIKNDPFRITIQFSDNGIPYNPLERAEPDTDLPIEDREIGGLGILIVKRTMDSVEYQRKDGKNILTIKKTFG